MQKRFVPDEGGAFPEWEEKTIEEACNVNGSNGTPGDKFIYIELGDVNKYGLLKRKNLVQKHEAPVSAKRVAKVDNVFFRSVRPGNKGHFHYTNEMSEQVVMSSAFFQLSMKDGDNGFLYQALNSDYFCKQVLRKCAGTAYPTISLKEFIKLKIRIPKSIEEQRKIAAALAAYDEMIAVKTAKLETWQECKKRMVKEIFDRTKRFRDDDGNEFPEWEEKTLGEVAELKNGYAFSSKSYDKNNSGDYKIITIGNLQEGKDIVINNRTKTVSKVPKNIKEHQILHDGDILVALTGATIGKVALNAGTNHLLNQRVGKIQIKDITNINNEFLYYIVNQEEFKSEMESKGHGSAQPNLSKCDVEGFSFFLPCIEEQQKIGSFLAEIDKEIQIQKEFIKTYADGKKRMMRELMEG